MTGVLPLDDQWEVAYHLAVAAHRGQEDKAGRSYFVNHIAGVVRGVADRCRQAGLDSEEASRHEIVAYLHDILEDTPVTSRLLVEFGIDPELVADVALLTRPEGMPYEEYLCILVRHDRARRVKAADMDSNTTPTRLRLLEDPATQKRLLEKYRNGFRVLGEKPTWNIEGMLDKIARDGSLAGGRATV